MPITRSAIKKLRQDKKRTVYNDLIKKQVKKTTSEFKRKPSPVLFQKLTSMLDKASKKHLSHRNKTARLKSRLSKLLTKKKIINTAKSHLPKIKSPGKKKSVV